MNILHFVIYFDYINKKDYTAGYIFQIYDDHIVLRRQITNELHIPKVSECTRMNHELYVKPFSTGSAVLLPQYFWFGYNC